MYEGIEGSEGTAGSVSYDATGEETGSQPGIEELFMNMLRRKTGRVFGSALAVILMFCMTIQAGAVSVSPAGATEETESVTAAPVYTEKQLYQIISDKLLARKKQFTISCRRNAAVDSIVNRINSISDSEFYSVFFDVAQAVDDKNTTDDSDYLYGLIRGANCYYAEGGLHFYGLQYFESKKQTEAVNRKVKTVAGKIKKKGKNRVQRIAYAYQYVISHVKYDIRKNCNYSAYDGFYKKKTVCNGYALMMYKLLMQMNIPCRFVTGSVKEGKRWYLHAWNIVEIKGKWYNLDACFDDADDGNVYSDYFLKTDKVYKKDHKKDTFYQTKAYQKAYPMAKKNYKLS